MSKRRAPRLHDGTNGQPRKAENPHANYMQVVPNSRGCVYSHKGVAEGADFPNQTLCAHKGCEFNYQTQFEKGVVIRKLPEQTGWNGAIPTLPNQEPTGAVPTPDTEKGFVGTLSGVAIAIEFHGDGAVTICKEIVDDFVKDKQVPERWREMLTRSAGFSPLAKALPTDKKLPEPTTHQAKMEALRKQLEHGDFIDPKKFAMPTPSSDIAREKIEQLYEYSKEAEWDQWVRAIESLFNEALAEKMAAYQKELMADYQDDLNEARRDGQHDGYQAATDTEEQRSRGLVAAELRNLICEECHGKEDHLISSVVILDRIHELEGGDK